MKYSWLPALLREIAEVAGLDAALALAEKHGGTRKKIPAHVRDNDHWLVQAVGREAAEKICAHLRQLSSSDNYRGAEIEVPLGPTGTLAGARRRLHQALAEGATAAEAARRAGMTERTAYRGRAKQRDARQGKLL